jgi:hypothetical protein
MRTGLKTMGLALGLAVMAGDGHAQDAPKVDRELASTALECVAVFDMVAPQFPDRAAEIQDYRRKAVAQFLRASLTKEADLPAYLDTMKQQVNEAIKGGKYQLMTVVNDCAQIYGTTYDTVTNK